ncbi:protein lifeguard 1-like [Venturia canescens]|uniref:protein lifeguard 1-like n=1 Tax=Venturia canescens TaxID=32260 RepID=UPI001C9C37D1|nr:protein lifeguard 1-like [Venturia canescens]XP_043288246.1 protein lifeguard 1-like [Venturia canescens]XP_043288247.1 protein lifeguard 1-like [Venturia canescens]
MTTWQGGPGAGYPQAPPGPGFVLPDNNGPYGQGPPPSGYPPYGQGPYGQGPYGQGPPPPGSVPYGQPQQPGMYGAPYQGASGQMDDPMGDDGIKGFDFSDKSIRQGFIRKVYMILMCQLLITMSLIALFMYHAPTQKWVQKNTWMVWTCLGITIVLLISMACCSSVRRKAPMNYVFLTIFTLAEGVLLASISSAYQADAVLMAVGITAVVCLGLTIFAFQTKWDFTAMHSVLFVALLILMLFGILAIFIHGKTMTLIYASLGAFVFSMYLVYDTQMMVGGNHKYSISPEEYIFAALNLYLDVVNIFLYILTIIGASRD